MRKLIVLKLTAGCITLGWIACFAGCISELRQSQSREDLKIRLQQLEDREEIRQLTMDYGRFLDHRDWDSFSRLFAEKDGEWIGGMGSAKGPQAIRKLMEETIGKDAGAMISPNYHVFANQIIDLDGGRASATTKWMFIVQGADKRPQTVFLGHYEDSLIRENGRWKFLRRVVHADIPSDRK